MRCKEVTSDFFKMFDLFSISQFLRYNQDEDYRTVSGGITSLLVVSIFAILFAGNAISTLNKTDIAWSSTKEFQFEPSLSNLAFGPNHKNLFTVGMLGVNLNDPTWRYFDIQMVEVMQVGSIFSDVRSIDMVPCTEQHFAMTDTLQGNFNTTESWRRLCPPLDSNFDIFGKLTSNASKYDSASDQKGREKNIRGARGGRGRSRGRNGGGSGANKEPLGGGRARSRSRSSARSSVSSRKRSPTPYKRSSRKRSPSRRRSRSRSRDRGSRRRRSPSYRSMSRSRSRSGTPPRRSRRSRSGSRSE